MTILLKAVQTAAFWDHAVCLDCSAEFEVDTEDSGSDDIGRPPRHLGPCGECGSPRTFQAGLILEILERIEPGEEGE